MSVKRLAVAMRGKNKKGQGMTEYIIIVSLVAIAAVAVIAFFGDHIKKLFVAAINVLSGNTATPVTTTVDDANKTNIINTDSLVGGDK